MRANLFGGAPGPLPTGRRTASIHALLLVCMIACTVAPGPPLYEYHNLVLHGFLPPNSLGQAPALSSMLAYTGDSISSAYPFQFINPVSQLVLGTVNQGIYVRESNDTSEDGSSATFGLPQLVVGANSGAPGATIHSLGMRDLNNDHLEDIFFCNGTGLYYVLAELAVNSSMPDQTSFAGAPVYRAGGSSIYQCRDVITTSVSAQPYPDFVISDGNSIFWLRNFPNPTYSWSDTSYQPFLNSTVIPLYTGITNASLCIAEQSYEQYSGYGATLLPPVIVAVSAHDDLLLTITVPLRYSTDNVTINMRTGVGHPHMCTTQFSLTAKTSGPDPLDPNPLYDLVTCGADYCAFYNFTGDDNETIPYGPGIPFLNAANGSGLVTDAAFGPLLGCPNRLSGGAVIVGPPGPPPPPPSPPPPCNYLALAAGANTLVYLVDVYNVLLEYVANITGDGSPLVGISIHPFNASSQVYQILSASAKGGLSIHSPNTTIADTGCTKSTFTEDLVNPPGTIGNCTGANPTSRCQMGCQEGFYPAIIVEGVCLSPIWTGMNTTCEPVMCQTYNQTNCTTELVAIGEVCVFECAPDFPFTCTSGSDAASRYGRWLNITGHIQDPPLRPPPPPPPMGFTAPVCAIPDELRSESSCQPLVYAGVTCSFCLSNPYPSTCGNASAWDPPLAPCAGLLTVTTKREDDIATSIPILFLFLLYVGIMTYIMWRFPRDVFQEVTVRPTTASALLRSVTTRISMTTRHVTATLHTEQGEAGGKHVSLNSASGAKLSADEAELSQEHDPRKHSTQLNLKNYRRFVDNDLRVMVAEPMGQSVEVVPRFTTRLTISNVFALISLVLDAIQYSVLTFTPQVPWSSSNQAPATLRQFLLVIADPDAWRAVFWLLVAASLLWVVIMSAAVLACGGALGRRAPRGCQRGLVEYILPLIGATLYLSVISVLLSALGCSRPIGDPNGEQRLTVDPRIVCWSAAHLPYAILALFGLLVYYPLALFSLPAWQVVGDTLDLRYGAFHLLLSAQIKLVLSALSSLFAHTSWVSPVASLVLLPILAVAALVQPPSPVRWLRVPLIGVYSLAIWAAVASLIAIGSPGTDASTVALYVGWAVILGGMAGAWVYIVLASTRLPKPAKATPEQEKKDKEDGHGKDKPLAPILLLRSVMLALPPTTASALTHGGSRDAKSSQVEMANLSPAAPQTAV